MDTEFELSTDDRFGGLLWDKARLSKPNEYYREVHPTQAEESDAILAAEKAKVEAKAKAATETKVNPASSNVPEAVQEHG
jgi:NADH-quinone oxidoreductase subunit I